ncbi:papain family cysteine protease (macronuclear) [Tetrahymena thermophila SB210]|uniref:Papain family cysteine protease n=1 Tax=Tetrahymena thermophila (strain SB210) TaxID=312017 RepID=Q23FQ7_TETTS|nr:papain family cysteine protease [Tetrahymena thermophila SB210]EAR95553.1 papain family cysteine protease [Tetrahymena thermophila SB210]|eukprot:XP_001015798.1 papain family cysteine protease [Tetrahymena thermophila SB210]
MQKLLIVCLLVLAVAIPTVMCSPKKPDVSVKDLLTYNKWRNTHQRVYLNEHEQLFRQLIFFENLAKVNQHNQNGNATYTIGLNKFSDFTHEEFKHIILNKKLGTRGQRLLQDTDGEDNSNTNDNNNQNNTNSTIAASIDWRNVNNVLNPVKDQGQCGSCWTFGAAGVMESFNAITNGVLKSFSEQQLVDCVHQAGFNSDGCNGGFQSDGVEYAIKFGIVTEDQYPYTAVGGDCQITDPTSDGFYPKSYKKLQQTADDLKSGLNFSPVTVSVDASNWSSYESGIFDNCGETTEQQLNHAVIAVGYDTDGNWIIRNSWSTSWGEDGYMRLAAGNTCGVLLDTLIVTA